MWYARLNSMKLILITKRWPSLGLYGISPPMVHEHKQFSLEYFYVISYVFHNIVVEGYIKRLSRTLQKNFSKNYRDMRNKFSCCRADYYVHSKLNLCIQYLIKKSIFAHRVTEFKDLYSYISQLFLN